MTKPMTKSEIAALRALEQASDKWLREISGVALTSPSISVEMYNMIPDSIEPNLRKLASLANQYIPKLLDENERLTAALKLAQAEEDDGR